MSDEGELIAGRYRLVSRLGSGAMGVVWQAHDERRRFRNDIDEEAMRGLESVSVVALPVAVTSGSLFRGWLDDDGDIAVEETDLAFVTVRRGMETIPKLCAVTTEKGLPRLAVQARCTARALSRKPL